MHTMNEDEDENDCTIQAHILDHHLIAAVNERAEQELWQTLQDLHRNSYQRCIRCVTACIRFISWPGFLVPAAIAVLISSAILSFGRVCDYYPVRALSFGWAWLVGTRSFCLDLKEADLHNWPTPGAGDVAVPGSSFMSTEYCQKDGYRMHLYGSARTISNAVAHIDSHSHSTMFNYDNISTGVALLEGNLNSFRNDFDSFLPRFESYVTFGQHRTRSFRRRAKGIEKAASGSWTLISLLRRSPGHLYDFTDESRFERQIVHFLKDLERKTTIEAQAARQLESAMNMVDRAINVQKVEVRKGRQQFIRHCAEQPGPVPAPVRSKWLLMRVYRRLFSEPQPSPRYDALDLRCTQDFAHHLTELEKVEKAMETLRGFTRPLGELLATAVVARMAVVKLSVEECRSNFPDNEKERREANWVETLDLQILINNLDSLGVIFEMKCRIRTNG